MIESPYQDWLEDNELEDSEDNRDNWLESHCQFCGGCTDFGGCGCDHELRY